MAKYKKTRYGYVVDPGKASFPEWQQSIVDRRKKMLAAAAKIRRPEVTRQNMGEQLAEATIEDPSAPGGYRYVRGSVTPTDAPAQRGAYGRTEDGRVLDRMEDVPGTAGRRVFQTTGVPLPKRQTMLSEESPGPPLLEDVPGQMGPDDAEGRALWAERQPGAVVNQHEMTIPPPPVPQVTLPDGRVVAKTGRQMSEEGQQYAIRTLTGRGGALKQGEELISTVATLEQMVAAGRLSSDALTENPLYQQAKEEAMLMQMAQDNPKAFVMRFNPEPLLEAFSSTTAGAIRRQVDLMKEEVMAGKMGVGDFRKRIIDDLLGPEAVAQAIREQGKRKYAEAQEEQKQKRELEAEEQEKAEKKRKALVKRVDTLAERERKLMKDRADLVGNVDLWDASEKKAKSAEGRQLYDTLASQIAAVQRERQRVEQELYPDRQPEIDPDAGMGYDETVSGPQPTIPPTDPRPATTQPATKEQRDFTRDTFKGAREKIDASTIPSDPAKLVEMMKAGKLTLQDIEDARFIGKLKLTEEQRNQLADKMADEGLLQR